MKSIVGVKNWKVFFLLIIALVFTVNAKGKFKARRDWPDLLLLARYIFFTTLPPFQLACLFPCLVIWSYGGLETEKFQAVASQIITITQIRNHIIPTSPNNLTGNEK